GQLRHFIRVYLEDGQVRVWVHTHHLRIVAGPVRQRDPHLPGSFDDVVVGEYVPLIVEDDAGALGGPLLNLPEEVPRLHHGYDGDHRRGNALHHWSEVRQSAGQRRDDGPRLAVVVDGDTRQRRCGGGRGPGRRWRDGLATGSQQRGEDSEYSD